MGRWAGGRIGLANLAAADAASGVWTTNEALLAVRAGQWPVSFDGLTAATAAPTAAALKQRYPSYVNGTYWIAINGTPAQVYCDMTSDGGGWMLYSSFGSGNPLSAATAPAISGNRITINSLSTNGYTPAAQSGGTFFYIDGQGNNTGYFIDEADSTSWLAFFDSGEPIGYLYLSHFRLVTPVVSQIRVRWGDPTNLNQRSASLFVNGTGILQSGTSVQTDVRSYTPNNTVGANSIYVEETSGIAGISWIYVR